MKSVGLDIPDSDDKNAGIRRARPLRYASIADSGNQPLTAVDQRGTGCGPVTREGRGCLPSMRVGLEKPGRAIGGESPFQINQLQHCHE